MWKRGRWAMLLGAMLLTIGLSGCHILDATPQFVSLLSCGLIACPQIPLTLTSTTTPFHVVKIIVVGTYQTVVMDSGTYVWNLPINPCTIFTTGTVTIPPGPTHFGLTCDGGLIKLF